MTPPASAPTPVGAGGPLLDLGRGPLVLLFYDGFERKALPGLAGGLYSDGRRMARYLWRTAKRTQVWTGFYTAFQALWRSLDLLGYDVRVNDFVLADRHPDYPIGIAGYPSVLAQVEALRNPRIFGPGDYGYPDTAAEVARDPRNRVLIQPSDWAADYYRPYCGDVMMAWPVGIDTRRWADAASQPKAIDVVLYDKIRWDRETMVPALLDRAVRHLEARGLSHATLRYGHHHLGTFERTLRQARALLFLCEHETQGLAYQEAMAMNVPVLAWDEARLVDPLQRRFAAPDLAVSSVPYFDPRCGLRYRADAFETAFDSFWAARASFTPRAYVEEHLSLRGSGEAYMRAYAGLVPPAAG